MPVLIQCDIFKRLRNNDVAIVFGHIGFNEMDVRWHEFKKENRVFEDVRDPFSEIPNEPHEVFDGKFIWFIPEMDNHGMEDKNLKYTLDRVFSWIEERGYMRVVTNGIRDIDHSTETENNRLSDDNRTRLLIDYARKKETGEFQVELTSLNDAFVRNARYGTIVGYLVL